VQIYKSWRIKKALEDDLCNDPEDSEKFDACKS